jgi:cytochrome c553
MATDAVQMSPRRHPGEWMDRMIILRVSKRIWTMKRMLTLVIVASLGAVATAEAAGDVAAGKAKAAPCVGCHGANGQGVPPNPALKGKTEDELAQAMKDYKSGKRDNAVMKTFAAPLNDQDIANLAAYYASLK